MKGSNRGRTLTGLIMALALLAEGSPLSAEPGQTALPIFLGIPVSVNAHRATGVAIPVIIIGSGLMIDNGWGASP